jgi:ribosomal protein S18 acetylase RimI-like enzyme
MDQLLMRRHNFDNLPPMPELPPGYVLREYQEGDLDGLAALLRSSFADENWTPQQAREKLIAAPDVRKTYVIAFEGRPVATTSVRVLPDRFPDSGYVHWVAVDPEHQGQRLGYIVTLAALQEFARMGLKDAVLETDDDRLAAIKTYQNLGFEPEHRNELHIERWAKVAADLLAAVNL